MTLRISLGELVASVPTILDAEPREAVVALALNHNGLPLCAMTVERQSLLDPDRGAEIAALMTEELAVTPSDAVVLITYTDEDVRAGCDALDALRLELEFVMPRVEVLAVRGERWFSPGCFDDDCCPGDGRVLPPVPPRLPRVIAAARARALHDARFAERVIARQESRDAAADAWNAALARGEVPDAATARRLAAALDDLCVRDWVVLTLLGAAPDAAEDALGGVESGAVAAALDDALLGADPPEPLFVDRARAVIERVARGARGKRRVAASQTLVGVVEWWEGNLDAAAERCERALASDAHYRLAELVLLAARRGIAPGWVSREGQTAT